MIRLMVPPLPAVSRPSKITITRRPSWTTHSCIRTSSVWSRSSSFSYCAFVRTFGASFAAFDMPAHASRIGSGRMTERELWSYTFRKANLVELAAAAAAAGFACVTLTTRLFDQSGGDGADLRARVEDHGVRVTCVDGLAT